MTVQTRLERFQSRTEWPLAGVALVTATLASWIVQRVAEEDDANQAATHAEIEDLRDEIRRLINSMTPEVRPAYGDDGGRTEGSG